jgi:hypothetical protein
VRPLNSILPEIASIHSGNTHRVPDMGPLSTRAAKALQQVPSQKDFVIFLVQKSDAMLTTLTDVMIRRGLASRAV